MCLCREAIEQAMKDPTKSLSKMELEQDLMRLRMVRKQREEAEKKQEEEKKGRLSWWSPAILYFAGNHILVVIHL